MIPVHELVTAESLRRYDDDGEPVYSPLERIVLILRWWDWIDTLQFRDVLGMDGMSPLERNRYESAISRAIKSGRIERMRVSGSDSRNSYTTTLIRLARKQPGPVKTIERIEHTEGTCKRCGSRPRVDGKSKCQPCLDADARNARLRRARRSA